MALPLPTFEISYIFCTTYSDISYEKAAIRSFALLRSAGHECERRAQASSENNL